MESDTGVHSDRSITPRSLSTFGINRQDLIQKIENLKKNWNFSMQSVYVLFEYFPILNHVLASLPFSMKFMKIYKNILIIS